MSDPAQPGPPPQTGDPAVDEVLQRAAAVEPGEDPVPALSAVHEELRQILDRDRDQ